MRKPIIGIAGSLYIEKDSSFIGNGYDYNNNNYSKCIFKAGGIPIYLPVINDTSIINEYLSLCDGLLLPGGGDINPLLYNEAPLPLNGHSMEKIDWFQITLTKKALDLDKPILGICRGIQIINVAQGGTLYQDVSYSNINHIQHIQNSFLSEPCHKVEIMPNTILNDILGDNFIVNSAHHQSVKDVAPGIKIAAMAPDGIIEAIESMDKDFVVGVQWHPEMTSLNNNTMLQLFIKFINSCKN